MKWLLILSIFSLPMMAMAEKLPCGLSGPIDTRMLDCSRDNPPNEYSFVLVTRTSSLKEVYKDVTSGLLWSDTILQVMDHYKARETCNLYHPELGGLTNGREWRLPTLEESRKAVMRGLYKLPNMEHWFWTSDLDTRSLPIQNDAWTFHGSGYGEALMNRYNGVTHSVKVRCVSQVQY